MLVGQLLRKLQPTEELLLCGISEPQSASIRGCHFLKVFLDTAKLLRRACTMGINSSIEFLYARSEQPQ